jgi:hypothetical protein
MLSDLLSGFCNIEIVSRLGFRGRGHSIAVRIFRYAADPLCLAAIGLYCLSRLLPMPEWTVGWFRDLLFLPAAVPIYLWIERRAGLRANDGSPTWNELIRLFIIWAVASEGIAPLFFDHCTADPIDVAVYAVGGIFAGLWWSWLHDLKNILGKLSRKIKKDAVLHLF